MNSRVDPLFSAAAAAILAMAPASSLAQGATEGSRLDAVIESGTLRVCTTGDYKPFTYHDPAAGSYEGIDIDLARSLAQALGVEPEFVATTWKALLPDFTADKCDIAMGGISVTLERQKQAFFSDAYLVNGKAPIARCEDETKFQTIEDIDQPGVTVIVNPGGTNETFVRDSLDEATIEVYPDNVTIFKQVLDGKADVMIAESIETVLQENLNPGLCAINPEDPLKYGEMGYLLPRGDVVFKAFVDQWLHLAKATGEFDRIYAGHIR